MIPNREKLIVCPFHYNWPFLEQFIPEENLKYFRIKNYLIENRKKNFKGLNNKQKILKSVLFYFLFLPTDRLQLSGIRKKLGQAEFFLFLLSRPTDLNKVARFKFRHPWNQLTKA